MECKEEMLQWIVIIDHFFSGSFAKLRKATIISVTSVRPSVRIGQLGSRWNYFHET